jgi:hypothetical protein
METPIENTLLIVDTIKISLEEHNSFQFESAFDYLENIYKIDKDGEIELTRTTKFWKWWVNQWNIRNKDLVFLIQLKGNNASEEWRIRMKEKFYNMHSVSALTVYPDLSIMDDSYSVMIQEVIDETHKTKKN